MRKKRKLMKQRRIEGGIDGRTAGFTAQIARVLAKLREEKERSDNSEYVCFNEEKFISEYSVTREAVNTCVPIFEALGILDCSLSPPRFLDMDEERMREAMIDIFEGGSEGRKSRRHEKDPVWILAEKVLKIFIETPPVSKSKTFCQTKLI